MPKQTRKIREVDLKKLRESFTKSRDALRAEAIARNLRAYSRTTDKWLRSLAPGMPLPCETTLNLNLNMRPEDASEELY